MADKIERSVIPIDKGNMFNFTTYEQYGVVGLMTPLNSPLLVACKLVPALPAGNIVVIKPSEFKSVSTLEFMELIKEADFSDGVVKEENVKEAIKEFLKTKSVWIATKISSDNPFIMK